MTCPRCKSISANTIPQCVDCGYRFTAAELQAAHAASQSRSDYHILRDDRQEGPFTLAQLQHMWRSGTLTSATLHWREGMESWQPLSAIARHLDAPATPTPTESTKRILPAFLLCFFFGPFGIHRFYCGHPGSGFVMLAISLPGILGPAIATGKDRGYLFLLLIVTGLWSLIDFIILIVGAMPDENGKRIERWT
jgi:GYF domain 2/TM2 domain